MRYEIKGGSFPVVICNLENGEKMITEKGSMAWMSPNMQMETKGGGLGKMFSRAFSGESMFQNIYTANGNGMIAFGSSFPGHIIPLEIAPGKEGLVHISKLENFRVNKVEDVVNIGDMIWVKVTDIDEKGRVNLSHKDAMREIAAKEAAGERVK